MISVRLKDFFTNRSARLQIFIFLEILEIYLWGDSDFDARVTVLGEFLSEVSVEFCSEDALGDMLSLLGDVGGSRGHDYLIVRDKSRTRIFKNRR
jgi:hypothetical protein